MALVAATAAALGISTTLATILVGVGSVAAAQGIAYVANLLVPTPKMREAKGSNKQDTEIGGDIPRCIIFGRNVSTAGQLVYLDTEDLSDKNLCYVIVLADYPCTELKHMFVDGKQVVINGTRDGLKGFPLNEYTRDGVNYMWVDFYDGKNNGTNAYLNGQHSDRFDATDHFKGCAYVQVVMAFNPKLFGGYPQCRFNIDGAPLYDPRLDDTVDGGSGDHRWDDIDTHELTGNPSVIRYNILRGIKWAGEYLYGCQDVDEEDIPFDEFKAAADRDDESVGRLGDPATENRYRASAEIPVDMTVGDALTVFNTACDGEIVDDGGYLKIYSGGSDASVADIDVSELLDDAEVETSKGTEFDESVNGVVGTFMDPDQDWTIAGLPGRFSSALEAADGNQRLTAKMDLSQVQSHTQAQRLMQIVHRKAPFDERIRLPLPPKYYGIRPGDTIRFTDPRLGWNLKRLKVRRGGYDERCCPTLDAVSVASTIWDWDEDTDQLSKDGERLDPKPAQTYSVADFAVDIIDDGGDMLMQMEWTPHDNAEKIRYLRWRWRWEDNHSRNRSGETFDVSSGELEVGIPAASAQEYEVQAFYELWNGNQGPVTSWVSVTSP